MPELLRQIPVAVIHEKIFKDKLLLWTFSKKVLLHAVNIIIIEKEIITPARYNADALPLMSKNASAEMGKYQ